MHTPAADLSEHRAGLDRGELVPVPQEDEPGPRGQRRDGAGQERQVHHGRLVHHQQVQVQGAPRVVPEAGPARPRAEQPVQGGRLLGQGASLGLGERQVLPGPAHRLGEPRRGLPGRGRKGHPGLPAHGPGAGLSPGPGPGAGPAHRLGRQERQDRRDGPSLAGTGPPRDDRQAAQHGQRGGDRLPVDLVRPSEDAVPRGEEPAQVRRETHAVDPRGPARGTLAQRRGQVVLEVPVAGEVEPVPAVQHERRALAGRTHHPARPQRLPPLLQLRRLQARDRVAEGRPSGRGAEIETDVPLPGRAADQRRRQGERRAPVPGRRRGTRVCEARRPIHALGEREELQGEVPVERPQPPFPLGPLEPRQAHGLRPGVPAKRASRASTRPSGGRTKHTPRSGPAAGSRPRRKR